MEKYTEKLLKELKEQQDEIAQYLFGKSDVEVTYKIVFENLPTSYVYSEEGRQALENAIQQFKEDTAGTKGVKTSIKVKIKDKPKEDSMKNRKFDVKGILLRDKFFNQ